MPRSTGPAESTLSGFRVFQFEADSDLRLKYISSSVRAICGYAPEELLGRTGQLLFPEIQAESAEHGLRLLKQGLLQEHRFATLCQHKNGSTLRVELLCHLANTPCGPELRASVFDLSSHEIARNQLRLSDEILNTVNSMVLVANGKGHIIYLSPSVSKILGYSSEEVLGYGWWLRTIFDNAIRKESAERIASCARGETPPRSGTWEERLLDKDGNAHWFLWQDAKGPADLFIGVGQEITERKQIEDALEQSSNQLRAIFTSALEGLLILDSALIYRDANPAACKLIGRSREEIIGKPAGTFSSDPPTAFAQFKKNLQSSLAMGLGEIRTPDGKIRHIEYSIRPEIMPGRHLVVTRNVTERVQLEKQLRQAQKMEAVGQLAGGVAHDFNNMLTVIRGYAELLQRNLDPQSKQRRFADTILSATDKATMTTQQLLAFSRQQVIQPRELNLNHSIQDTGKLLHRLIGEDVRLRFSLAEDLGLVKLDPGQLNQIILNLAVNARDAMPNGGVLTIETANASIDSQYADTHLKVSPGDYVMLTVTDSGVGMSAETISRIFEPFYTTKPAGKGTGLGLSTVYGIVEQAGGAIYVYSEPGEGTSFKLYFPRIDAQDHEPSSPDNGGCNRATVLLIDDDVETCRLTQAFLNDHGYDTHSVQSGGAALKKCQEIGDDLAMVISDVTMPGADGHDIAGYLTIRHPDTKTIFISGYTKTTLLDRGILDSDAEFLQKPFRMEDLLHRIEELLQT